MIDTDKYEGHLMDKAVEDNSQVWVWKNWMLKNAETIEQHRATAALLNDAPLLLAEVKRLRKALYWVAVEETRDDVDYMWEGVDEILSDHPRWAQTKCIQTGEQWDYTKRDWTIDTAKSDVISDGLRRMIE